MVTTLNINGWFYYSSGKEDRLDPRRRGKWMYFFDDQTRAGEYGDDFEGKMKLEDLISHINPH